MSFLSNLFLQPMQPWAGQPRTQRRNVSTRPSEVPPRGEDRWAEDKAAVKASLGYTESGNRYDVINDEGYIGKYQFGRDRLTDLGLGKYFTMEQFKTDPNVQEWVMDAHLNDLDRQFAHLGIDQYEGQNVGGVPMNRRAMYSMAHLGGAGGLHSYLKSGGEHNPADSNDTSLRKYGLTHGADAARRFASRQAIEVSDIQTDLRNTRAELADFEEKGYTLMLTPEQRNALSSMEPFEPMGDPSVQSTAFDPYEIGLPEDPNRFRYTDTAPDEVMSPEDVIKLSTQQGSGLSPEAMDPASPDYNPSKLFSRLEALGLGLAQMSAGETVNLSPVWNRRQQAAQFDASMDQRQYEFEENSRLRNATEARLTQQFQAQQQALAGNETGRAFLANHYVQQGGDPQLAAAIASSPEMAGAYISQLFPSGGKQGVVPYSSQEDRDKLANVAQANGAPQEIVEAIRSIPDAAQQYAQTGLDQSADERRTGRMNTDSMLNSLERRANMPNQTAEQQEFYRNAYADALDAYDAGDSQGVAEVFEATRARTASAGKAGGAAQAEADVAAGTNSVVANSLAAAGASDATIEMAKINPDAAFTAFNRNQERAQEQKLADQEAAAREILAQDYDRMADNAINEESAEQLRAAANHIRNGDSREAASIMNQVLDKPSSIKQVEWAMAQPDAESFMSVLKELKRAESGNDLERTKQKAVIDQHVTTLATRREEMPQLRRTEEALMAADAIARSDSFSSGQLVNMFLPFSKALSDLGIQASWNANTSDQEVFQALSNGIVQFQRAPGSGHMSDWDAKTLRESIFNLGMSEIGNRALIQYMSRVAAMRQSDLDADTKLFLEGDLSDTAAKDRYRREHADSLGLATQPFYALDRADGNMKGNTTDDIQANTQALIDRGILKDGDIVMVKGKLVPFNMEAFNLRYGNE